jgi:hypothetical protein
MTDRPRFVEIAPGIVVDEDKYKPRVNAMVNAWNQLFPGTSTLIMLQPIKPAVHPRMVTVEGFPPLMEIWCELNGEEVVFGQIPVDELLAD